MWKTTEGPTMLSTSARQFDSDLAVASSISLTRDTGSTIS